MELSGVMLERIATALGHPPAPRADDGQRRREPRVGVQARVTVLPLTDSVAAAPFEVAVRDLSPGGIGFVHTDRIGLDQQIVVLLPGEGESLAVLCQVAYYQPLAENSYAIGARFLRVLRRPAAADDATLPLPSPNPSTLRRAAS